MSTLIPGYNIKLKLATNTFIGVTQDDLQVTAQTKESITKDDAGVKQTSVVGQEVTFKVAGLVAIKAQSGETTKIDADDMLAQSLKTGSEAIIAFVYDRGAGANYQGNCIMTDYAESSPADPDSDTTYTASYKVVGSMTRVTQ